MWEIIGYICSLFIGISVGLIGAGGSILSLPILVYLFGISPLLATTYSLFVVSATSAVGSIPYIKRQQVSYSSFVAFGLPSIIAIVLTRRYLLPMIPEEVFDLGGLVVTNDILLMTIFAMLMIGASANMIKGTPDIGAIARNPWHMTSIINLILLGSLVGVLAGLVGAGGGFMIIPALVLVHKLPMKYAVGTSLVIITVNSFFGFFSFHAEDHFDWSLLMSIVSVALIGIIIGTFLSTKIDGTKLKKGFGYFILAMGIYVFTKELILPFVDR